MSPHQITVLGECVADAQTQRHKHKLLVDAARDT